MRDVKVIPSKRDTKAKDQKSHLQQYSFLSEKVNPIYSKYWDDEQANISRMVVKL